MVCISMPQCGHSQTVPMPERPFRRVCLTRHTRTSPSRPRLNMSEAILLPLPLPPLCRWLRLELDALILQAYLVRRVSLTAAAAGDAGEEVPPLPVAAKADPSSTALLLLPPQAAAACESLQGCGGDVAVPLAVQAVHGRGGKRRRSFGRGEADEGGGSRRGQGQGSQEGVDIKGVNGEQMRTGGLKPSAGATAAGSASAVLGSGSGSALVAVHGSGAASEGRNGGGTALSSAGLQSWAGGWVGKVWGKVWGKRHRVCGYYTIL